MRQISLTDGDWIMFKLGTVEEYTKIVIMDEVHKVKSTVTAGIFDGSQP